MDLAGRAGREREAVRYTKVKHPEWIPHCNIDRTVRLSKAKRIPDSIEGFMLVTACKHLLRCVYGSNLQAAWALLCEALWDKITIPWHYLDWRIHRKQWENEEIAEEMKDIAEEVIEGRRDDEGARHE